LADDLPSFFKGIGKSVKEGWDVIKRKAGVYAPKIWEFVKENAGNYLPKIVQHIGDAAIDVISPDMEVALHPEYDDDYVCALLHPQRYGSRSDADGGDITSVYSVIRT